jgi:membrane-associated phospholipid phosphatase
VPRRPLDILNLAVLILLLLMTFAFAAAGRMPDWRPSAVRYAVLIGLMFLIVWCVRKGWRGRAGQTLANFYPLLVIAEVFNSLQPLITALGVPNRDRALAAIDRALLGGWDATAWTAQFIRPWLNDLMHVSYCTYYVFPIVVGIAMWRRSPPRARRFIFAVVLAFYVSYAGYFLVPARGPRFAQWPQENVQTRTTPISRAIYDTLNEAEKTKDDVFPSGHNMITAVCLIAAWRFDRRLFAALLPVGVLLAISTVYCRFHYVIDVIAGIGLAFVTLPLANAIYDRWARRHPEVVAAGAGGPEGVASAPDLAAAAPDPPSGG